MTLRIGSWCIGWPWKFWIHFWVSCVCFVKERLSAACNNVIVQSQHNATSWQVDQLTIGLISGRSRGGGVRWLRRNPPHRLGRGGHSLSILSLANYFPNNKTAPQDSSLSSSSLQTSLGAVLQQQRESIKFKFVTLLLLLLLFLLLVWIHLLLLFIVCGLVAKLRE